MGFISGRRLVWGINCLLILAAAMIFRPVRTWIDQVIVARILHPNLKVHEIHWHRSNAIAGHWLIQAEHLDWGATEEGRCFGITSENAWIVLENLPLTRRVASSPRAVFENSRLFMETLPESNHLAAIQSPKTLMYESEAESIWQRYLDSKHRPPNWQELRKQLDSILQTDAFTAECTQKVESWISESQRIASAAQGLAAQDNTWVNPLRDPSEVEKRLGELERLHQQRDALQIDFQSLEESIQNKVSHIGQVFQEQRNSNPILSVGDDQPATEGGKQLSGLAAELMQQACKRKLDQFTVLAEFADRMCRAALRDSQLPYDRDLGSPGQSLFNMEQLTAKGMFRCDPLLIPFRMQVKGRGYYVDRVQKQSEAEFKYQYESTKFRILVAARNRESDGSINEMEVEWIPVEELTNSETVAGATESEICLSAPQWLLVSHRGQVTGKLQVDRRLAAYLFGDNPSLVQSALQALEANGDERSMELSLAFQGDWKAWNWTFEGEGAPFWLLKEIMLEQQRRLQSREEERVALLERYFHTEIDRLEAMLGQLLDQTKLQSQQHSDTIMTVRKDLEDKLSEVQQLEFARQPKEDVRR